MNTKKTSQTNAAREAGQNEIEIKGVTVTLDWDEQHTTDAVGMAIHTVPSGDVGDGPIDGEEFEFGGKKYRLGQHDYSTDQPGNEGDLECTCTAAIYASEQQQPKQSVILCDGRGDYITYIGADGEIRGGEIEDAIQYDPDEAVQVAESLGRGYSIEEAAQ